jgi:amino acid adenylation domain-containing protein
LKTVDPKRVFTQQQDHRDPLVAFMFPGQGAQQANMGRELYEGEPVFRNEVDTCAEILRPHLGLDLRTVLYPEPDKVQAAQQQLTQTFITQPAMFVIEYALAKLWMAWGIRPGALIGHSIGEYVAACLADVFSLEDALSLLAARAKLMQQLPGGAMLAVRLPEAEVEPLLTPELSIAALNSPAMTVVSGPHEAVEALEKLTNKRRVATRHLPTSHAFHSAMMDTILEPYIALVKRMAVKPPQIPWVSTLTGKWITTEEATDPAYWARQLRQPVRFAGGLKELLEEPRRVVLEVGPGQSLSALARQHPNKSSEHVVVSSLPASSDKDQDLISVLNALGRLWLAGVKVDWSGFYAHERRRRVLLPTYPFERKRCWIDPVKPAEGTGVSATEVWEHRTEVVTEQVAKERERKTEEIMAETQDAVPDAGRPERIIAMLKAILHEMSGVNLADISATASFVEMGFDSLFLTQASQSFQNKLGVKITFRQLLEDLPTLSDLALYVDRQLPLDALPAAPAPSPSISRPSGSANQALSVVAAESGAGRRDSPSIEASSANLVERIIKEQLQLMAQQIEMLRSLPGGAGASSLANVLAARLSSPGSASPAPAPAMAPAMAPKTDAAKSEAKYFGPFKPIEKGAAGGLTSRQQKHLEELITRYNRRTAESKRLSQLHRRHLADPRAVTGYRQIWKEMVYPIVSVRSAGSKIWDVDGNEYVDLTMGFGLNLFGHSPAFVTEAIEEQLRLGVEIGPQSRLAGKVAELVCELTGQERVTFCNTGSEAVMAAIRVARTVTGRDKIVYFTGDYHGIFDEVLVRPNIVGGERRTVPIAPGIPHQNVGNVIVLEYGSPESLEFLKAHGRDLAAVLVEPVQSRRPDFQPKEFLQEVRHITEQAESALIFDEVVTGFRVHPGGVQGLFGIKADLATYGKVVGGGLPIGILAGKGRFMDALDGGQWSYGDASFPEVGVTFFAGTFVRHPLALASAWTVLNHLKKNSPQLQNRLNERTARLVESLNAHFRQTQVPMLLPHFASFFAVKTPAELPHSGLLLFHMREKGVHIWENRGCFISTAHTDEDLVKVERVFKESVAEMQAGGFLPETGEKLGADSSSVKLSARPGASAPTPPSQTSQSDALKAEVAKSPCRFPLTEAQKEVWLATKMGRGAACAYNESLTLRLRGKLNVEALRSSLQDVVDRHDALRTTFSSDGEFQQVVDKLIAEVPFIDLSGVEAAKQEQRAGELLTKETTEPFDLAEGPLVRLKLVRYSEQDHLLIVTHHHLVCDGWSMGVLLGELSRIYSARVGGAAPEVPPAMQFSQYAASQSLFQQSPEMAAAENYWTRQFSGSVPTLELPGDRARPAVRTYRGGGINVPIQSELFQEVKRLGARRNCTILTTLLAAFYAWLYRLSGQEDLVVGIPAAGQMAVGSNDLVGHCANLLPLRMRVTDDIKFIDFLSPMKRCVLDAYEHQNYTFGTLIRKLKLARDLSRVPLVSVMFNVDRRNGKLPFSGLSVEVSGNLKNYFNFDLGINAVATDTDLYLEVQYNADIFDAVTVRRLLGHYETLLAGVVRRPDERLGQLPLLSPNEQQKVLVEWNQTSREFPSQLCLHELVEAQAKRTPDAIAVACKGESLTYRELDCRANRLAHRLRKMGVGSEVLVGTCIERSVEMLVSVLGILKAGGAYVPLDPAYPRDRLKYMIEDSRMVALIAQKRTMESAVEGIGIIWLDKDGPEIAKERNDSPDRTTQPDHLAYVIYTSGSTGRPKGVQISHRSVVNFLWSMKERPGLNSDDVWLAVTTLSFDIAGLEIFLPLITGAKIHLATWETAADGRALVRELESSGATVMQATPITWRMLLEAGWKGAPGLKMLCGGEAMPRDLAERLVRSGKSLWNVYGPTETTIWSTLEEMKQGTGAITIGRPIANTTVYILDRNGQPVPLGVPGELHIGGTGLARGYLNRPELTSQKFIPDGFSKQPCARLYRTGDLARYREDGKIECLGRIDHQVKIRGFRIELGEIESLLGRCKGVKEAVVVAREENPGNKRLVAYVVNGAGSVSVEDMRNHLRGRLPEYMVPSAFVMLDKLPLTPNGKVDRKALPAPDQVRGASEKSFMAPRTRLEEQLARLWEDILGVKPVGVTDNFFELGGHSLIAVRLFVEIEKRFGRNMPLQTLFEAPTVEHLAKALGDKPREDVWSSLVRIRKGGSKAPFFFVHAVGGNLLNYSDLVNRIDPERSVYGLQSLGLDGVSPPHTRVEEMADYYIGEIKKVQPDGPYYFGGLSFGGLVAYEMARQLHSRGEQVGLLALFDSYHFKYQLEWSTGTRLRFKLNGYLERLKYHSGNLLFGPHRLSYLGSKSVLALKKFRGSLKFWYWGIISAYHRLAGQPLPPAIHMVRQANGEAFRNYMPLPYDGVVTLFRATKLSIAHTYDTELAWRGLARGGLEIHDMPGDHVVMMSEPNVRILADKLNKCLATAESFHEASNPEAFRKDELTVA